MATPYRALVGVLLMGILVCAAHGAVNNVVLAPTMNMSWEAVGNDQIQFVVNCTENAWFAIGFSSTGMMKGPATAASNCVLATPNNTVQAQQYLINGTTADQIIPSPSTGITAIRLKKVNGHSSMSFVRGFDNKAVDQAQISKTDMTQVMYAIGNGLDLSSGANFDVMSVKPIKFSSAPPPPSPSKCKNIVGTQELAPSMLSLEWEMHDDCTIDITATLQSDAWLAIGLSNSAGTMVGSDTFIGRFDKDRIAPVAEFRIVGTDPIKGFTNVLNKSPNGASLSSTNGVVVLKFTRDMYPTNEDMTSFAAQGEATPIIWAYGPPGEKWIHHVNKGGLKLDFESGKSSSIARPPLEIAHGVVMFFAMGVLLPFGAFAARFLKDAKDNLWFRIHRPVQAMGVLFAIAGLALAIRFTQTNGVDHFSVLHAKLGLAAVVLTVIQPLNAFIRPGKGKDFRDIWEVVHKGIGWIVILFCIPVIYLGLDKFEAAKWVIYAYCGFAGLTVSILVGAQVHMMSKGSSSSGYQIINS